MIFMSIYEWGSIFAHIVSYGSVEISTTYSLKKSHLTFFLKLIVKENITRENSLSSVITIVYGNNLKAKYIVLISTWSF